MKINLYLTSINLHVYLTSINKNNNIKIEILNFQMMHQFYLVFPPTPHPHPGPSKKNNKSVLSFQLIMLFIKWMLGDP